MMDKEILENNIKTVLTRIEAAALKSGRKAEDITLVAVTKTIDVERIKSTVELGVFELGENRVQELLNKFEVLDSNCNWHLIGHLQSNKVKYIIDKVDMIHSVDSMPLALEIHNRALKIGKCKDILVQVNVAGESTKFGLRPEETLDFVKDISKLSGIRVRGLMTIAPFEEDPELIRYVFRDLRKIYIDINKENIDNIDMDTLSMGMSNDFEVAIEEGSTLVRIGSAIFGRRI